LADIAEAIAGIEATIDGESLETFALSWTTQRAVERGLEIVSEASRGLDLKQVDVFPDVAWRQIADIGNLLRHEYHRVEPTIIWNITHAHLPRLKAAVQAMLQKAP